MKRRSAKKILGKVLFGVAIFIALYVGGWLLLTKGVLDVLGHRSLYKVIIGAVKVLIGFPTIESLAGILAVIGRAIVSEDDDTTIN